VVQTGEQDEIFILERMSNQAGRAVFHTVPPLKLMVYSMLSIAECRAVRDSALIAHDIHPQ
jgi:hypothetical protein